MIADGVAQKSPQPPFAKGGEGGFAPFNVHRRGMALRA
jgi:hypothetical protein